MDCVEDGVVSEALTFCRSIDAEKKCYLTDEEAAAIRVYTGNSLYDALNEKLRQSAREDELQSLHPFLRFARLLHSAMMKLPDVGEQTVFRGVRVSKANLDIDYKQNADFAWGQFTSCSLQSEKAMGFGTKTVFAVKCFGGRSIRNFSAFEHEDEVLLPIGTRLRVTGVLPSGDKCTVLLDELHHTGQTVLARLASQIKASDGYKTDNGRTPLSVATGVAEDGGHETVGQGLSPAGTEVDNLRNDELTPPSDANVAMLWGFGAVMRMPRMLLAQVLEFCWIIIILFYQLFCWPSPTLFFAAQKGHKAVVRRLLAAGAEVDKVWNDGATPLIIAAQNGHKAVVGALLAAGAEVDKAANEGKTPLFIAAQNGHEAVVGALVARGAEVDKARIDGATPLIIAARNGHDALVEMLVAAGAAVGE